MNLKRESVFQLSQEADKMLAVSIRTEDVPPLVSSPGYMIPSLPRVH